MFRQEKLKRGMNVIATGIPKSTGISFEMRHPEVLLLAPGDAPPPQRPVPIYPLTEGLLQKTCPGGGKRCRRVPWLDSR